MVFVIGTVCGIVGCVTCSITLLFFSKTTTGERLYKTF